MKTFFSSHCLRNQGACCDLCIRTCPRQALAWRPGSGLSGSSDPTGLARDAARCRGCGLCACVCPAGVFAPHVDNRQIVRCLDNLPPEKRLVLFCPARGPLTLSDKLALGAANALRLKACPSALHVSVLAALAVLGISDVDCICGDCAGCGRGDKGKGLLLLRQAWQSLFSGRFSVTRPLTLSVAATGTEPDAKSGGENCVCVETHKVPLQRRRFLRALFAPEKTRPGLEGLVALEGAQWADTEHPVLRGIFQDILHVLLSGPAERASPPDPPGTGGSRKPDAPYGPGRPDNSNGSDKSLRPDKREASVKAVGMSGRGGSDDLKKIVGPVPLRESAVLPELIGSAAFIIDADSCTACGACFRACPSGALSGELPGKFPGELSGELSGTREKDGQPVEPRQAAQSSQAKPGQTQQIMFLQRRCLDCGLCLAVCHTKALRRVEAPRDLKTWLYGEAQCLARHELKECARCHGVFHSASDDAQLCRFCAKRGGMLV